MKMATTQSKSPYYLWESFQNGMYKTYSEIDNYDLHFNNSILLLSNQEMFYETGIRLLNEWPISCDNFLNNSNINKIAFIGQACCCLKFGCPEIIVKEAWKIIDSETRNEANKTASIILKTYERSRKKLHSEMEEIWIR